MKITKSKLSKTQKVHIAVIVLGIIFVILSGFHSNIWFDEAYSVGIADRSFEEIWTIGGHDVHPVLYYWVLKIISIIIKAWGVTTVAGKILAYRIFSMIPIVILGILGYTHIRKDFGEKVGIIFSFLVFFIPEVAIYANEIRMYSWGMLAISILAIYAYRLAKASNSQESNKKENNNKYSNDYIKNNGISNNKESNTKDWIIFFLASISSIYLHYYGLMAAGIINMCLLIYFIKNKRKGDTIKILIFGVIQALAYLPWLVYLVSQLKTISNGFWIGFKFPDTIIEILSSQFIGELNYYVGFIFSIALYIYLGITLHKTKEDKTPVKFSIGIYVGVILAALIMTILLTTSILYYRYLFIVTGLYIFTISFILSKEKNPKVIWGICVLIVILATWNNIKLIKANYDENNLKQFEYLQENVQSGDIIVYEEIGHGSTVAVWFPDNRQYFYNEGNWGVEEAYKAFGENYSTEVTTDFLDELSGRIWIIDKADKPLYNKLFNNDKYTVISEKLQYTGYHWYCLNMILVEKN